MFCEKCGTKLEPGELFCPTCGTKVENASPVGATWHSRKGSKYSGGMGGHIGSVTGGSMLSRTGINLVTLATGLLMLLGTLLPFISINLGKLGEIAGEYLGDVGSYVKSYKLNFYQLITMIRKEMYENTYKALLVALMIFVIVSILVAIVSSLINNRALMVTSGVMSGICFLLCVAFLIAEIHYLGLINEEIPSYLNGLVKIKLSTINGFGLTLFTLSTAAHSILSIRGGIRR